MKAIRKILVALDFSEYSTQALQYAADLARRYDAKLELVTVFDVNIYAMPDGIPMFAPGQFEQLTAELKRLLEDAKRDALAAGALQVETHLIEGNPSQAILRFASEAPVDLIVLGTHGRTGVKHWLLGSVAERVVQHAACPVFVAKAPPQTEPATLTAQPR
jgi:universal stress protein A